VRCISIASSATPAPDRRNSPDSDRARLTPCAKRPRSCIRWPRAA
jgi:hypothetical protein